MSPSATAVGEIADPVGEALQARWPWDGGTCRPRRGGRSGAERGVWRVGRRGPDPQTSPSPQGTPTSSRASTTGASPRAASKPSQTPPNPWVPSSWTAPPPVWALGPPDPPERPLSPETATVSEGSVGCRAAFGTPPASSVPAGGGPGLPLKGTCGCVEGSGSPTGPAGCGCGKSVPEAELNWDAAGDAGGAKSRRVETQGRLWH